MKQKQQSSGNFWYRTQSARKERVQRDTSLDEYQNHQTPKGENEAATRLPPARPLITPVRGKKDSAGTMKVDWDLLLESEETAVGSTPARSIRTNQIVEESESAYLPMITPKKGREQGRCLTELFHYGPDTIHMFILFCLIKIGFSSFLRTFNCDVITFEFFLFQMIQTTTQSKSSISKGGSTLMRRLKNLQSSMMVLI